MRRFLHPALYAAGALLLLLVAAAVLERLAYAGRVLPGVRLDGVEVAGRPQEEARSAVAAAANRIERAPLVARAAGRSFPVEPETLGVAADEGAVAGAVARAGRQGNPLAQLLGPLTRRLRPLEVGWAVRYRRPALERAVADLARRVDSTAVDGGLRFQGATVVRVEARPGRKLDRPGAVAALAAAVDDPVSREVALPAPAVQATVGPAEVARAAGEAERVLAGPATVLVAGAGEGGRRLVLQPALLGSALLAVPTDGRLQLRLDQGRLRAGLRAALAGIEQPPRDARFVVQGGKVRIVPGLPGRRLGFEPLLPALLRGERTVPVTPGAVEPRRTTAWARSLNIHELVSTFTTRHKPGQPRVRNIHLAADILRGEVVPPGERFSLNRAIGPRTEARGFVRAPIISEGNFSEGVGGGVSQLATTTFNAIFFGGYKIVSHQPHSFYISRYPMGREATVSRPAPDLVFENDSRSGVLIHTSYTETSITVTFYGDRQRTVRAEGPRILATHVPEPETEIVEDPKLPVGTVIEEPAFNGYDVEVFRVITEPGQPTRRERFFTRYRSSSPKIIRGTMPV